MSGFQDMNLRRNIKLTAVIKITTHLHITRKLNKNIQ